MACWKSWAILYTLGLWVNSLYVVYYIFKTEEPSVFGIFVVVTPTPTDNASPNGLLGSTKRFTVAVSALTHMGIHTWLLGCNWRRIGYL